MMSKSKQFRNLRFIFVMAFAMFMLLTNHSIANEPPCLTPKATEGVIDLRCWDGQSKQPLSGQWMLNYKSLQSDTSFQGFADVPGLWRELNPALPYLGSSQYHLKVILSEPIANLALKFAPTDMARKLTLVNENGHQTILFDSGNTSLLDRSITTMHTPIIHLPTLGVSSELIIDIHNSESFHGGIELALIIGPVDSMVRYEEALKISTMAIATILFLFFIVNGYLWLLRDRHIAVFALSLMAFLIALRQVVVSGIIYTFYPNLSLYFYAGVGWGTFFLGIIFGFCYFRASYPNVIPKWLPWILYFVSSIGLVLFIFQPLYIVQIFGSYYRLMVLVLTIILIGYLIRGLKKPDSELRITVYSSASLLICFALDIVYFHLFEDNPFVSITALGMLIFMATQTLMMSSRYWKSIQKTADLAIRLKLLNRQLEDTVTERTRELALKNKQLKAISRTDPLTGLANRRAFDAMLRKEITHGERTQKPLVMAIIDIDHFKIVNDELGHDVGDIVLKDMANIISNSLRANDFAARWGGEEFCMLLPETNGDESILVAERIRQSIENFQWSTNDPTLKVTASFGLALWEPGREPSLVFKEADKALYEAKGRGRNQVITAW